MGFPNIFARPQSNQQAQANQQQPQGNDPANQQQKTQGQPVGTPSGQLENAGDKGKQASPLDAHKDMWEPPKTEVNKELEGNTQQQKNEPADYVKLSGKLNFSRGIPPELMTKAMSGDATAFGQILDNVGRSAFAAASKMAEQISERSGTKFRDEITGSLPGEFRKYSLNNTAVKNPVLSNPAVKPLVEGVRLQLASKYPDATTEELQQKAEDYFLAIHKELGTSAEAEKLASQPESLKDQQKQQQDGTFDWDNYMFGKQSGS